MAKRTLSTVNAHLTAIDHLYRPPERLAAMSDNYEVPRDERPAVAAPAGLHARYETDAGTYATTRI